MIRGRGALNRPQSLCVQTSRRSVTDCCLKRTRSERRSVLPKATPAGADRANCKVGWPVTLFEQGMSPRWTSGIATTWLGPAPFPATSELCGQAQIRLARGGQARSSPVKLSGWVVVGPWQDRRKPARTCYRFDSYAEAGGRAGSHRPALSCVTVSRHTAPTIQYLHEEAIQSGRTPNREPPMREHLRVTACHVR